jgi:hypothetical protein
MCIPEELEPADIEDIIAACMGAEPKLTDLIKEVIAQI